ncbi:MAG: hypothetical protein AABW99_02550 [archaeon]
MDILGAITGFFRNRKILELKEERAKLLDEIKMTENAFLKKQVTEKHYNELNGELHKKLIALDAEIDSQDISKRINELMEKRAYLLQHNRRKKLERIMEQKDRASRELENAKRLFLKRKIDAASYESIAKEKHFALIELEAEVNRLYRDEAKEIMIETGKKIAFTEKELAEKTGNEMAEDIMMQLPKEQEVKLRHPRAERHRNSV